MANNHAVKPSDQQQAGGEVAANGLQGRDGPASKHHFEGKYFFLDIGPQDVRTQIKFGIEAMKGTVEEFLNPKVNYLITDRPRETWPHNNNNRDQSPGNTAVPTSAPTIPAPAPAMSAIQRANMSRAKLMLEVSLQNKAATTDALQIAYRLGVKPIESSRMMLFLDQHVDIPGRPSREPSPSTMKSVKVIPITGSFIKIESVDQRSRPIAKTFRTWPELVLEPGTGCPFRFSHVSTKIADQMKKEQLQKQQQQKQPTPQNSHSRNMTPVPSPMPSPSPAGPSMPPVPQTQTQTQMRSTPKDQQIRHGQIIAGHGRKAGVASWSRITPQPTDPNNPYTTAATGHYQPANGRHVIRGHNGHHNNQHHAAGLKRKTMVCEVCEVAYTNLAEHVDSHSHQQFLTESDNFKELVSVINSLPKLSDLIATNLPVIRGEGEEKENEGENETPAPASAAAATKSKRSRKNRRKDRSRSEVSNSKINSDHASTQTEDEEIEATSAYDVTHIREKMSIATIASPIPVRDDPIMCLAYDVEI